MFHNVYCKVYDGVNYDAEDGAYPYAEALGVLRIRTKEHQGSIWGAAYANDGCDGYTWQDGGSGPYHGYYALVKGRKYWYFVTCGDNCGDSDEKAYRYERGKLPLNLIPDGALAWVTEADKTPVDEALAA